MGFFLLLEFKIIFLFQLATDNKKQKIYVSFSLRL